MQDEHFEESVCVLYSCFSHLLGHSRIIARQILLALDIAIGGALKRVFRWDPKTQGYILSENLFKFQLFDKKMFPMYQINVRVFGNIQQMNKVFSHNRPIQIATLYHYVIATFA